MKKLRFKSYASLIAILIISFNTLIQLMFSALSCIVYSSTNETLNDKLQASQLQSCQNNFENMQKYIHNYIEGLKDNGVFDYIKKPINLFSPERYQEEFFNNVKIESQLFMGRYIKKCFIIGENKNYGSILFGESSHTYPTIQINRYNLSNSGVMDYIHTISFCINKFSADKINFRSSALLTENELSSVKSFVSELDGSTVYCEFIGDDLCFIELDDTWFTEVYNPSLLSSGLDVAIINKYGDLLYDTGNYSESENSIINAVGEYKVCVTLTEKMLTRNTIIFYTITLSFSICFIIFSIVIGKKHAYSIAKPYLSINNIIKMHSSKNELKPIEISSDDVKHKSDIMHSISRTMILAIILPNIVSGIFYSGLLTIAVRTQYESYFTFIKEQMVNNTISETDKQFSLINVINDAQYRNILSYYTNQDTYDALAQSPNSIVLNSDFETIFDPSDIFKSKVSYSNKQLLIERIINSQDDMFIINVVDDNNSAALFCGKRIRNNSGDIIGYHMIYNKPDLYNSCIIDTIVNYMIVDNNGKIIAYNDNSFDYGNYDIDVFIDRYSKSYMIDGAKIPHLGFTLYTLCSNSIYMQSSTRALSISLIYVLATLCCIIIILWRISMLLKSPLEIIKSDMDTERRGVVLGGKDFDKYDEIVDLIETYNKMISGINTLMEEKTQLVSLNAKSEMKALQHQINPHFLYNTLEILNLQALNARNYEMSSIIVSLTKLFRYALSTRNFTVPLRDELNHAQNYAKIQEKRFAGRIKHIWNIDEKVMDYEVIKLILQPLIENSITHGFEESQDDIEITISVYTKDSRLIIEVADTGLGMTEDRLEHVRAALSSEDDIGEHSGIALCNIRRRLKLHYGSSCDMQIESRFLHGTTIRIII